MRIYCDMDDILCETAATLCRLVAQEFDVHIDYEDVREFDLQRVFGLSDADMRRFMVASHSTENLLSYPPTRGAIEGVKTLLAAGHEVEIVTGRPTISYRATKEWLARFGLGDLEVVYVDKYGRLYPGREVQGAPRALTLDELLSRHYDVAIDDSPMVLPALSIWRETEVMVFDRPWNRSLPLLPNMKRVDGWRGVIERIGLMT